MDLRTTPTAIARLDLHNQLMDGPLVVLAPHPDDEAIGCGGLIAAYTDALMPVRIHYLTDGRHSHPDSRDWPPSRIAQVREQEATRAAHILGVPQDALHFHREVDGSLLFDAAAADRLYDTLEKLVRDWPRLTITAPWRHDPHPDHIASALIAKRLQESHPGLHVLSYIVWSDRLSISSHPEARVFDASAFLHRKHRAVMTYESQSGVLISDSVVSRTIPALVAADLRDEIYLAAKT